MPKLSIIVPTYNSSKTIGLCLKSIERQTFTDFEIVIQDGCSADGTVEKIQGFQKRNSGIRVVLESTRDHGVYDAMNRAVERANGEWLYFLGSDDELFDKHVLKSMMSPEHTMDDDVLYGNVQVIGNSSWAKNGSIYDGPFDLAKLLNRNICHQSIFYRSTIARQAGKFNLDYIACSDWDFNLRCWALTRFKYVDMTVARFYAGGISSGKRRDERFSEDVAANVVRYFDMSPLDPLVNSSSFAGGEGIVEMQRRRRVSERESQTKAIAFYLPQFHPIPENDKWWGKGFTEWSNVVKAKPLFPGHYQPQLPADLGFYDLRLAEAREAQAELAREYGIYGFCYYHYWFNGRRFLERPVSEIVAAGQPDFPFCLCWANENWTKRWDGLDYEILVQQVYSESDDADHIRYLLPILTDPRYITVDGKPMFLVYRANRLPAPERTTEIWRHEARRAGLPGLFLVRVESFPDEVGDPRLMGFDAALEFQPRWQLLDGLRIFRRKWWQRQRLGTAEPAFIRHCVIDYDRLVEAAMKMPTPPYPFIRCVCPGFDNTARRQSAGAILKDSTPASYARWLSSVIGEARSRDAQHNPVSEFVFINAWNEWAEGNHLEPCQKWQRAYLESTRDALKKAQ